jgi:Flp pilus assembly protein TadG
MIMHSAPISPKAHLLARVWYDTRGATLTEFAFVGPVFVLMLMGLFDMTHSIYTTSLVNGAMQSAARNMTIEGATLREAQIDERVKAQVRSVVPNTATINLEKLAHFDFSDVGQAEEYTDMNGNGTCDNNEPYIESNGIANWQANRGSTGIGGARDVVLYKVTVTYPRLFPIHGFVGMSDTVRIQGATVLRNQPFDEQNRTTTPGNCT